MLLALEHGFLCSLSLSLSPRVFALSAVFSPFHIHAVSASIANPASHCIVVVIVNLLAHVLLVFSTLFGAVLVRHGVVHIIIM